MTEETFEKILIENYTNVFKELLLSAFKSNPKLTPAYLSEPNLRQREIENEILKQSHEMATFLVGQLKERGDLSKEPPEKDLRALIERTLQKFGVKK
jgi:hypothetical protein